MVQKAHFDWEEAHHHLAEEAKQQAATEARKQVRKLELKVLELQMEKQVEAESLEPIQLEKQHQLEALQRQATFMKTQLQAANYKINKMSDLADQMIELQQQQQQQLNAYSEAAEQAQQRLTKKEAVIFRLEAKAQDLQQPTEQKLQEGSGHQRQASMQREIDLLELELHRLRPTHVENPLWDPSGDSESVPPGGTTLALPPAQDNSRNQLEQAASPAESRVEASVPNVKRTAPKLKKQGSSAYKASKLKKQAAAKTAAAALELLEAAKAAAAVPATADHSEAKAAAAVPAAPVLLEQAAVEKRAAVKVATQEQPPPSHTESAKAVAEAELDPVELKELTIIIEAKSNELFDLQQLMLQSPKSRRKALKREISGLDLEIAGLHSQIPKTVRAGRKHASVDRTAANRPDQ